MYIYPYICIYTENAMHNLCTAWFLYIDKIPLLLHIDYNIYKLNIMQLMANHIKNVILLNMNGVNSYPNIEFDIM